MYVYFIKIVYCESKKYIIYILKNGQIFNGLKTLDTTILNGNLGLNYYKYLRLSRANFNIKINIRMQCQ